MRRFRSIRRSTFLKLLLVFIGTCVIFLNIFPNSLQLILLNNDEKQLNNNKKHVNDNHQYDGEKDKEKESVQKNEDDEERKLREDNLDKDVKKANSHDEQPEGNDLHFEKNTSSPGFYGDPVFVNKQKLSPRELKKYDDGWKKYAFNNYVSDMISVDRTLVDGRDKRCLSQTYTKLLPATSVIICFQNEAWSTLVRTIHSVINKSPRHLIHEIILVDDASTFDHLMAPLEEHVATLPVHVKIIRAPKREGLIRARLLGYEVATGETLTFLDSHCECTDGWLEPLMARIADGWNHVVCPNIPTIDKDTFGVSHISLSDLAVGNFNWKLQFTWGAIPAEFQAKRKSPFSPLPSPTMAGGLFSINRKYFQHIGTYDRKMNIWGGENLEISFRIWMCGGTLEILPCSLVGHVFRDHAPYSGSASHLARNTMRVAMVWLDEYKQIYFNTLRRKVDYGDLTERIALRRKLGCKSFDWYMKNVFTNAFFPMNANKTGQLYSVAFPNTCIDSTGDMNWKSIPIEGRLCTKSINQIWYYVAAVPEIRQLTSCLDFGSSQWDTVITFACHELGGNQHFTYTKEETIYFKMKQKCLEVIFGKPKLVLRDCNGSRNQKWKWRS